MLPPTALDLADTSWYPILRLFRLGAWEEGGGGKRWTRNARNEKRRTAPTRCCGRRYQWGELIDKITILEIKAVEIVTEAALANVRKELALLNRLAGRELVRDEFRS